MFCGRTAKGPNAESTSDLTDPVFDGKGRVLQKCQNLRKMKHISDGGVAKCCPGPQKMNSISRVEWVVVSVVVVGWWLLWLLVVVVVRHTAPLVVGHWTLDL